MSNYWNIASSSSTTTSFVYYDTQGRYSNNVASSTHGPEVKKSPLYDDKKSMSFRIHVEETDEEGVLEVWVADSLVDTIETEATAAEMTDHFQLEKLLVRYYDDDHEDTDTELDIIATINSLVARLQGHVTYIP